MMKLAVFVFLAVLAYASAGLLAYSPTTYTAEGVHQIHSPWAASSSSRVQTFNDAVVPAVYAAPYAAAAHYAAPYAAPYAAYPAYY